VLGREFPVAALARVGHISEDELLDMLDEAIDARVVSNVPGGPGHLRFAHVLIRETLYEGLSNARRIRMHRLTVEALEALYGDDPGPHLAELAHHSIGGRDFDKGLRYARRAGDRALDLLAYEEAVRLYENALEALQLAGRSDERTRCELLLSCGTAAACAGNTPAADKALVDAAGIARRLGLSSELARAAAEYGGRMVWGRGSDAPGLVPLLEEGLAGLGEEDVELRARLLARLAGAVRDEGSRDRRDALSAEAVELARRTGNPAALVDALDGRAMAILAPDTIAECIAVGSELREVAERIGDRERVVDGYMQSVAAQVVVGDVAAIEADLGAASPLAQRLGQPAHIWDVLAARAMLALAAGKFGEGEELVERAFALGERAVPGAIPVYRLQRYTLCDFLGCLEQVESAIGDLVAEHPARAVFRCVLAHLHGRLGRLPEAKRALAELAEDDFSDLPFDQEWLFGMSLLTETSALVGDADSASVLYALLLPWAALNVADMAEGIRGSVSRYVGLAATTTKRWEEAELHFEDALAMNERMGARPWLAHAQQDYARLLLTRDAPGDRERAQGLLDAALAIYRELGMETHAASASALAEEGGAPDDAPASGVRGS
jgi:tetratricopeptide (TPR) repeat protein